MEDKQFVNQFVTILGILVGIAVLLVIIASYLYSTHQTMDLAMLHSMEKRLEPVGKNHLGTAPAAAAQTDGKAILQTAAAMDSKTVYNTACAVCHAAGIANAPIYGDKTAWQPRLATGIDTLYASSINGKGAMPAKGGRADLSDQAIKDAVDYMLKAVQ